MTQRKILVTGATGNQGGAVASALLQLGLEVHALVRDPSREKAEALARQGAKLVRGDLNDAASLRAALANMDSIFVLTTPFAPGVGIDGEIAQGRTIVEALSASDVGHVVYSSVSDADRETGVPHFDSKADAERLLIQSGLPVTITGPVFFSDNVLFPWNLVDMKEGRFRQAMPGDRKLQLVSLREIGRLNAAVLKRGPELAGRRINYAGDELTPIQMTEVMARASGRALEFVRQPLEEVRATSEDLALMYDWFDRVGYTADIPALRNEFPEVEWSTFEAWATSQDWEALLG